MLLDRSHHERVGVGRRDRAGGRWTRGAAIRTCASCVVPVMANYCQFWTPAPNLDRGSRFVVCQRNPALRAEVCVTEAAAMVSWLVLGAQATLAAWAWCAPHPVSQHTSRTLSAPPRNWDRCPNLTVGTILSCESLDNAASNALGLCGPHPIDRVQWRRAWRRPLPCISENPRFA